MVDSHNLLKGSGIAAVIAGPLFLGLWNLFYAQEQAGAVMQISLLAIPGSALLLGLSVIVGVIIAFPTCLLVGGALATIAAVLPILRSTALWLLAAGGIAFGILTAFGFDFRAGAIAFILTAVVCAAIVRVQLDWD